MQVRPHRSSCDEADHAVHLVPLPIGLELVVPAAVVGTLCGELWPLDHVETVAPGTGMPCSRCTQDPDDTPCSIGYQGRGWPVVVSGDRVLLVLGDSVTALALPSRLVDEVVPILVSRDRQAAVLSHPASPGHPMLLVGEPFGVPLPWPADVHTIGGAMPLPPTSTELGPVRWLQPPHGFGLANCREIDVFSAVRTASLAGTRANGGDS